MTKDITGYMAGDLSGYFELAAQVIPVLLLALVIESGFLPQLRAEVAAIRAIKKIVHTTTVHPAERPIREQVIDAAVASLGAEANVVFRVVTYVQANPKVHSFLAVLAIDVTLIGAVICEGIALACVVFDFPRRWEEILGVVVLAGLAALLGLTLQALRKLTVARVKTGKDHDHDNAVR